MSEREVCQDMLTVTDLAAAGLALQGQSLALLLAEVQALAILMPGNSVPHPTEAEIEAEHDNMPV